MPNWPVTCNRNGRNALLWNAIFLDSFLALECDDVLAEAINCATPMSDYREAEAYGCEQPPSKKSRCLFDENM